MNFWSNTGRFLLVVSVCLLVSACLPMRDGIDYAYEAYSDRRKQCGTIRNPSQRNACMHIAMEQMAGAVENYSNNWERWQPPDQWIEAGGVEMKSDVEIYPAQQYTPTLPSQGPTKDNLNTGKSKSQINEEMEDNPPSDKE